MIKISSQKPTHPLVVSVPHAGVEIPDVAQKSFTRTDPLLLSRDSDLYVDELYEAVPALGGVLLSTTICRYVIDPNRDPKIVDASFIANAPVLAEPPKLGIIAHQTMLGEPLLTRPLTRDEYANRLTSFYQPFHDALENLIAQSVARFGYCLHIDAHSMPSMAKEGHPDAAGSQRPDVNPGDRYGTTCNPSLVVAIGNYFMGRGLSVQNNIPYEGGFISQHYGQPQKHRHSIQIELNRKLYMDEKFHAKLPDDFGKLQKILTGFIETIRDWRP